MELNDLLQKIESFRAREDKIPYLKSLLDELVEHFSKMYAIVDIKKDLHHIFCRMMAALHVFTPLTKEEFDVYKEVTDIDYTYQEYVSSMGEYLSDPFLTHDVFDDMDDDRYHDLLPAFVEFFNGILSYNKLAYQVELNYLLAFNNLAEQARNTPKKPDMIDKYGLDLDEDDEDDFNPFDEEDEIDEEDPDEDDEDDDSNEDEEDDSCWDEEDEEDDDWFDDDDEVKLQDIWDEKEDNPFVSHIPIPISLLDIEAISTKVKYHAKCNQMRSLDKVLVLDTLKDRFENLRKTYEKTGLEKDSYVLFPAYIVALFIKYDEVANKYELIDKVCPLIDSSLNRDFILDAIKNDVKEDLSHELIKFMKEHKMIQIMIDLFLCMGALALAPQMRLVENVTLLAQYDKLKE